jgi:hypothetical protein
MEAYATSTAQILVKYEQETNPVTKASYRTIIGNRIDRAERFRLDAMKKFKIIQEKTGIDLGIT